METITINKVDSPIGTLTIGATKKGICMLEFDNEQRKNAHYADFTKYYSIVEEGENNHLQNLAIQLAEYFNKTRKSFDIKLDLMGTEFQISVWKELQYIPYGSTRSYKEQAIALNNLKGIRAVANANGQNKIAIIIPCHRVIGSDGNLTGFGGGLWRKKHLLELESSQVSLF